ncbi:MAG: chromosomal replication initiator protein DnaA [Planctomycetota bacterium]
MMDYLRQQHPAICRQWFEQLEPVDLDAGLLRVRTAGPVQQKYLQKKCLDPFTEAAQSVTGQLIAVRFVDKHTPQPADKPAVAAPATAEPVLATAGAAAATPAPAAKPPAPAETDHDPFHPNAVNGTTSSEPVDFEADHMILSPDNTFDTFITGPNNQMAHAAATAVAHQPGTAYNPLFIHGGVGLGKTHLLQAVCQKILDAKPDTNILYVSCDAFMNHFIECVQRGQMHDFRHRYRHVDVLVIDDIHFLANRDRSQEEFFHTFNELYQSNRQIVLSSDAAPTEIPHLEDRLVSRFKWGLVAAVMKPGFETRVAIIKAKAKLRGVTVPEDVIDYIAKKVDTNARELEGAITNVLAYAQLQNRELDLQLARDAMGEPALPPRANQTTLQHIIDAVTDYYQVKLSDLQSRRRHKSITEPRQVCMWLARKRTRFSLEEIGGYFGGRDHTTVMHSIRTTDDRAAADPSFARQLEQLDTQIRASTQPPPEG